MNRGEWEALSKQFLHHRIYGETTIETYGTALRTFIDWCEASGVDPETATEADIANYQGALRSRLKEATVTTRLKVLRTAYAYLMRVGRLSFNPVAAMKIVEAVSPDRDVLSFEELARVWDVSEGIERVVVGLLALCGLTRNEVRTARAADVHQRAGVTVLSVGKRSGPQHLGYVALPEVLVTEIENYLKGRRTGMLVKPHRSTAKEASLTFFNKLVNRVTERAGIKTRLTSSSLTSSLLSLALEYRFSYLSVMRSASRGTPSSKMALLRNVDIPPEEHASMRLGRMLSVRTSEDEQMLLQARTLLADRSQHPATVVMVAGAALERVLRETCEALEIAITVREPGIGIYVSKLRERGVISNEELNTLTGVGIQRNDAAHGWFDKISDADAEAVVKETRALISKLRSLAIPEPL
ncbi:tyrosine-type recombinase/integrase [Microbacterium sp. P05]|uniref:tyrosine-type recombinase/integrase n=1 Tax=Microbacterium sp. P05 TaxID=3366948 RepID=UPI003744C7CA